MSNREEREHISVISRKERERELAEQKAEAAQKMLTKFLSQAREEKKEQLHAELLDGVRHGSRSELDRAKRGFQGQVFLDEPLPTGNERYPWEED